MIQLRDVISIKKEVMAKVASNQFIDEKVPTRVILAIAGAGILSFTGILSETSLNVTFPHLMREFDVNIAMVQWVTTAYLLAVSLVMTTSAFFKATLSSRQIFLMGFVSFIAGVFISALAPTFPILIVGRLASGVGTGFLMPLMFNIILTSVPLRRIGTYMGIGAMISSMAPAFGPTFGGTMAYYSNWRYIFWILVPIALIAFAIGIKNISNKKPINEKPLQFDFVRFGLLGATYFLILYGLASVGAEGKVGLHFAIPLVVALILIVVFIRLSQTATRMFLNIQIFKNKAFVYSVIIYMIVQFSNLGMNFMLPNFGQIVLGATSLFAGLMLFPGSVVGAVANPLFGRMLDKMGPKKPLYIGNAIFTVLLLVFALMGAHLSILSVMIFYLLFTIGRSMTYGNVMANGLREIPAELRPDGNAIFNTFQQIAGALGTTVMSLFMTMGSGNAQVNAQDGSIRAWIFLALLGVLNFWLLRQVFKHSNNEQLETN